MNLYVVLGLFEFLIIPTVLSANCSDNEIEIRYAKKTGNLTNESFSLYKPGTTQLLYTSPPFSINSRNSYSTCIAKTDGDAYDLVFSQPEWNRKSYLEFYSPYDTITYKNHYDNGTIQLSFYTPILKNSVWHVLSWREMHWTDINWNPKDTPMVHASAVASHAFSNHIFVRKVIQAPKTVAAYELQIKYKEGVIAYVNGYEVFRDNLGSGIIDTAYLIQNSYSAYDYHGVIRNGYELDESEVVVAIEVHSNQVIIDFDAWLSVYGSVQSKGKPSVYYYPVLGAKFNGEDYYDEGVCDYDYFSTLFADNDLTGTYWEFDIGYGQSSGFMYFVLSTMGSISKTEVIGMNNNDLHTLFEGNIDISYDEEKCHVTKTPFMNFEKIKVYINGIHRFPIAFTELRPVLMYEEFTRDTPIVEDVVLEYATNQTLIVMVQDNTYFRCEPLESLPNGLILSDLCIFSGAVSEHGDYLIPVYALDSFGAQFFYIHLTISSEKVVSYNETYKTVTIVVTIVICVFILALAVLFSFLFLRTPTRKVKVLQRTV